MRLGVHLIGFDFDGGAAAIGPTVAAFGAAAEEAGLDNVSVMDHYFQMEYVGGPELNMLEGYTTLGFLAAHTSSVDLQLLVTGVTYRHPGLLAKILASLDVLSGGRAVLGIGAAWYQREHLGLGVPFPPVAERFERLEETLQVVRQMWGPDTGPFEGRHYRLAETVCVPPPLQAGGPRILVGGSGERKTLRLVATYADACNLFGFDPDQMKHKIDVLDGHCADVGRDPAEVRRTALAGADPFEDLDGFLRRMEAYAALGIDQVWVMPPAEDPVGHVSRLCDEVLPRLRDLG